jgi:uncharacterized protein
MVEDTATTENKVDIEVAYAKPEEQTVVALQVPPDCTIAQAVGLSGLLERFPEINAGDLKAGVFGVACKLDQLVGQGDRVEIYRPLLNDPKEARRQRANKK